MTGRAKSVCLRRTRHNPGPGMLSDVVNTDLPEVGAFQQGGEHAVADVVAVERRAIGSDEHPRRQLSTGLEADGFCRTQMLAKRLRELQRHVDAASPRVLGRRPRNFECGGMVTDALRPAPAPMVDEEPPGAAMKLNLYAHVTRARILQPLEHVDDDRVDTRRLVDLEVHHPRIELGRADEHPATDTGSSSMGDCSSHETRARFVLNSSGQRNVGIARTERPRAPRMRHRRSE
jgi:hypothetical protein